MITQEYLKEILDYNQETGVFTWKISNLRKIQIGKPAGCLRQDGYNIIGIKHKHYAAHRLAWLYHYGEFPKNQIDHINGNRSDNRIINLRVVSYRQNQQNQKIHREGHLFGTTYNKSRNKWRAQIIVNGKKKHLGSFDTEEQAHEAYLKELKIL